MEIDLPHTSKENLAKLLAVGTPEEFQESVETLTPQTHKVIATLHSKVKDRKDLIKKHPEFVTQILPENKYWIITHTTDPQELYRTLTDEGYSIIKSEIIDYQ